MYYDQGCRFWVAKQQCYAAVKNLSAADGAARVKKGGKKGGEKQEAIKQGKTKASKRKNQRGSQGLEMKKLVKY